jgi:hypothetical protein
MSTTLEKNKTNHAPKLTHLDLSSVPTPDTPAILEYLRSQAANVLASALGGMPLVNFLTGAQGNFPYYYIDPNNLNFNVGTYNWINTNMLTDVAPIQQSSGNYFTNLFISVLSKISYKLSVADQATLNAAYTNAQNQQMAVLMAWKAAYGSFPSGTGQPIDNIMSTIANTWAKPATTLLAIKNSVNLNVLLNNAPASGSTIMPVIAAYLNALGSSVTLANAVTMNNAYVAQALAAVQTPSTTNGGMLANDNNLYPGYTVTTPLPSIINNLQSTSNSIKISMNVSIANSSEYSVSINGGTAFNIPFAGFFGMSVGGNASYFHDEIVQNSSSVNITMTFTGATLVNYTPNVFNQSTGQNWFFMQPILNAIANGSKDVSGFKFSPNPGIDFSANGPFGILQGVAIANYPSAVITIQSSNYQSIQTTFQQTVSTSVSFLGIPLGGGSESTYSHSASSSSSNSTVTITLNPPPTMVAGTSVSSVGWILGVQTNYPCQ